MIKTFQELVLETEKSARARPALADELLLRSPGVSEQEAAWLSEQLPGLSPIYLYLLKTYDLRKISLGGCFFNPYAAHTFAGLVQDLVTLNQVHNHEHLVPFVEKYLQRDHAYHVACTEDGDSIAIVYQDHPFRKEQVLCYHPYSLENPPIVLAHTFDDFFFILGNIKRLRMNIEITISRREAKEEFWRCVKEFVPNASDETLAVWNALTLDLDEIPD